MHFLSNLTTFLVLIMISGKLLIASQGDVLLLHTHDPFMPHDTVCLPAKRSLKSLPHLPLAAVKKFRIPQKMEEASHVLISIKSITEAAKRLSDIDSKTWVLLDVDSTLTSPADPRLSRETRTQFLDLYNNTLNKLSITQKRIFEHFQVMHEPRKLVEEVFPEIIEAMQQKKGKVFAFTSATMASLCHEAKSFSDWRYQELKSFGIDFTEAYPYKVFFKEEGLDCTGIDRGIIYCGFDEDKSKTLLDVLKFLKIVPAKVIFIDDKEKNIKQVAEFFKKNYPSINFLGVTYTAMDNSFDPTSYAIEESDFRDIIQSFVEKTNQLSFDSNFAPLSPDLKSQPQSQERVRQEKKSV